MCGSFTLLLKVSGAMSQTAAARFFRTPRQALGFQQARRIDLLRFRAELAKYPAGSREGARNNDADRARPSLRQRMFAEADATLDAIAAKLDTVPVRVRIRYLLERGRTRNSGGD